MVALGARRKSMFIVLLSGIEKSHFFSLPSLYVLVSTLQTFVSSLPLGVVFKLLASGICRFHNVVLLSFHSQVFLLGKKQSLSKIHMNVMKVICSWLLVFFNILQKCRKRKKYICVYICYYSILFMHFLMDGAVGCLDFHP